MNNTKWNELRNAMYELASISPLWRVRIVGSGYVSDWDGEWFYHFRGQGYEDIEWVEIKVDSPEQKAAVLTALRAIHVPGHATDCGFKVYGYAAPGTCLDYI